MTDDTTTPKVHVRKDLREKKLRQEIRKLQIANDIKDARKLATWQQAADERMAQWAGQLHLALNASLPSRFAQTFNLPEPDVRKVVDALLTELIPKAPSA
jgi:hypothetical protein